jgi:phosphopantothenoylcysteine decarboxylase/phosphopantothenate--cysteine ligase
VAGTLAGRVVVVGVCGSIAAYKVAIVVRQLRAAGAEVPVLMTPAAVRFVGPPTFRALAHQPVITDMWDPHSPWDEPHVALGERADLYLIAPATADMVGRLAAGLADDVVSATALATRAPILIAPAMSDRMATSPVVEDNLARLRARGVHVIGPERGPLASGKVGLGRMSEPEAIVTKVVALLGGRKGRR